MVVDGRGFLRILEAQTNSCSYSRRPYNLPFSCQPVRPCFLMQAPVIEYDERFLDLG